jgi:hypothetical protein
MWPYLVAFQLVLASSALAASLGCPSGTLTAAPLTATGASADTVSVGSRSPGIVFQTVRTAGSATVQVEICCVGSCAAGGNWALVENSPMTVDGTTPTAAKGVLNPTCQYRANVTACSSCSVTVGYACVGQ